MEDLNYIIDSLPDRQTKLKRKKEDCSITPLEAVEYALGIAAEVLRVAIVPPPVLATYTAAVDWLRDPSAAHLYALRRARPYVKSTSPYADQAVFFASGVLLLTDYVTLLPDSVAQHLILSTLTDIEQAAEKVFAIHEQQTNYAGRTRYSSVYS